MSETKEKPKQKIVTVQLRVTEHPTPLPGTAAWVLEQIRGGYLSVGVSKSNKPGVWLHYGPEHKKTELLALYDDDHQGTACIDHFPFDDSFFDGTQDQALGVNLTEPGINVLKQLAKKAKVLLKLRLRQGDRKGKGKLSLSLTVKDDEPKA